ncbi:MAG TPA: hypothetical protein VN176_14710 [Verrucomicrobiae bacterium]|jgi:hypothetical protein|nr:hypothetical protein [Verrucomicrobiae bacterium]
MGSALLITYAIGVYGVLPATLIWGWARWVRAPRPRTLVPVLAFVGFLLVTVSALLAISTLLYARIAGGFRYYDPALMRIYGCGLVLSLAGGAVALRGVWRPSPVRWHAPACAFGMFVFWLMAAASE